MSALAIKSQKEERAPENGGGGSMVRLPITEQAEENNRTLIERYQRAGDKEALDSLLARNQGLLHTVLKRFPYMADPYEDLLQVANLGLVKAAQRFDLERAVEFSSYASAVVDGEVRHYLRDSVLMRQPRWLRNAEKTIEAASVELSRKLKRNPTLKEISDHVNISEDGVLEILRYCAGNAIYSVDDERNSQSAQKTLDRNNIRSQHYESFVLPIEDKIALEQAMDALSAFQKKIVYLLFYKDLTQTEVARELGLNQRKVSRESAKALGRLRAVLNTKIF